MNPDSLRGLRWGLSANGVDDRCTVHAGDNADHLPSLAGCADRVHLGLLPTSEGAWASGAKALRIEGGCMHIHANVKEERVESEGNRILASIREILGVMPELTHVEQVKCMHRGCCIRCMTSVSQRGDRSGRMWSHAHVSSRRSASIDP